MTSNGRVARLSALALATGTLVAAGAGSAAAATSSTTDRIQALGNGSVVHVRIALPVALPQVGQVIDQYISLTDGTVTTVNNLGATSIGQLGKGSVPVLSDLLSGSASSALNGKQSDSVSLVDQDVTQLGLSLKALAAKSNVATPVKDGVLSHSESTVAAVKLNGLGLPALNAATAPVVDAVTNVVGTAQDNSGAAAATVTGVVDSAISQIQAAVPQGAAATDPVKVAVDQTTSQLKALLNTIQTRVSALDANTSLIDLGVMKSTQTISRTGHQVTSDVKNSLLGASLLGGLISVDALASEASATAGGKAGTAAVTHTPGVLTVKVADALTLKIGQTIELGGTIGDALPADLKTTVNGAVAQVLDLLRTQLGLNFEPGTFVESVAKDGSSAATTVSAAKLSLLPPALASLMPKDAKGQPEKLVSIDFVAAQAAVGAQLVTPPAKAHLTPPNTLQELPHTGANLPLTGAVATGLIGLALVARRRRLAHLAD
ncbi:MAG: hypothetical protein WCD35_11195 [Mycobacteriales bacterium]